MGTALDRSESETDLAVKAASYEMPAWSVDGMDVLAVEDAAARSAVARPRRVAGPQFLEFRTYRFRAHSMYDPELYREQARGRGRGRTRDPIALCEQRLRDADVLDDAARDRLEAAVAAEIDDAVAFAEAGTLESRSRTSPRYVYAEEDAMTVSAGATDHVPRGDARGDLRGARARRPRAS